jgi:hypothetical protein
VCASIDRQAVRSFTAGNDGGLMVGGATWIALQVLPEANAEVMAKAKDSRNYQVFF